MLSCDALVLSWRAILSREGCDRRRVSIAGRTEEFVVVDSGEGGYMSRIEVSVTKERLRRASL